VIAGVINGHIASKYIYVRLFRGTEHMHRRSLFSTGTWVAILVVLWTIAWVIAEAVPQFNNLLSLVVGCPCSSDCMSNDTTDVSVLQLVLMCVSF
jgi:hypothetical protein